MNELHLRESIINNNEIRYEYELSGEWRKYFKVSKKYILEYSVSINEVPVSIINIPFILNMLPLVWVFDAKLYVDELDNTFYNSIIDIKNGYSKMYPMIDFKGEIIVKRRIENSYLDDSQKSVAAFFSGGVDALSTLINHLNEKPVLITLFGSDIKIRDIEAWNTVKNKISFLSKELCLKNIFIKTSFREILNYKRLDKFIQPIANDKWWHGFQHGIAIIGHSAPISYKYSLSKVYIASSFTKEYKVTCASDPTIDNEVKFASTTISHDGYEFDRGQKLENICNYSENKKHKLELRVCLGSKGDENCCRCEKCYRTIVELILLGRDPRDYGFNIVDYYTIKKDINNRIILNHFQHWDRIKRNLLKNREKFINDDRVNWIMDYDFRKNNKNKFKYVNKIIFFLKRKISIKK